MTLPHDQVVAACDALRADAKKWADASDAMNEAAASAYSLVMGAAQFGYVAYERGLAASYTALQEKIAGLVASARDEFDKISVALVSSADTYEREDNEGAHNIMQAGGS